MLTCLPLNSYSHTEDGDQPQSRSDNQDMVTMLPTLSSLTLTNTLQTKKCGNLLNCLRKFLRVLTVSNILLQFFFYVTTSFFRADYYVESVLDTFTHVVRHLGITPMCICMYVGTYVCIMCVYVCMYMCVYVCIYVCMYMFFIFLFINFSMPHYSWVILHAELYMI